MKQNIDIIIITYNRLKFIKRTLDFLFAKTSPIREFEMTILDNCSTDGTSEFLVSFAEEHPNLKVIRNIRNIGGNANICRAYETSLTNSADYVWVLCDDDTYDFSHWSEVEKQLSIGTDVICVCNYAIPKEVKQKEVFSYLPLQLSFVPAGIYKKSLINDQVLTNMYDAIYTMFQQDILCLEAMNRKKSIYLVKNEVVHNGVFEEHNDADYSYIRGTRHVLQRRNDTTWSLGFSNVLTYLDDEKLRKQAMIIALNSKCIFLHGISDFLNTEIRNYVQNGGEHYLEEIKNVVDKKTKKLIDKKIIEFENEIGHKRKEFFVYEDKRIKTKLKNALKKHCPNLFKFLKRIRSMLKFKCNNNHFDG
ncbi:MAG: glycosyltransferase family 2 protein, partial [Spirochaetales bacterium]|nr:glycosyltransferase family 2 protein [Spirochaetales bacterium]